MDLEELKISYERLFELTEDGTEFRYFKSKKEYRQQKPYFANCHPEWLFLFKNQACAEHMPDCDYTLLPPVNP